MHRATTTTPFAWTLHQAMVLRTMGGRDRAEPGLPSHGEMQAADNLPSERPYTINDILSRGWYPDGLGGKP
jgi:hypothetical protein